MTKERILEAMMSFVVLLLAVSAVGYLFFPSTMLSVVGIEGSDLSNFLARTLGAAFVALIPSTWNARKGVVSSLYPSIILGIAIYMFLSSAVDLHAFLTHIVNGASVPSIVFRVALGTTLLWLMPQPQKE